jgi:hypothetical protein
MSDDTVSVRVERGDYRHAGEQYGYGDELEVPEKVLEQHPNSLSRVETDESAKPDEPADEPDETDADTTDDEIVVDPHPSDLTVEELRERIGDVDDVDLLEAIKDAEKEGKNRETAKDALKTRIRELREE